MKRVLALFLAIGALGDAGPYAVHAEGVGAAPGGAISSGGLPRVSLSLSNPALGQPAPAPGFFEGLASGLLRTARQAAGSWMMPAMNLIPDGGPAPAPPALPPSLLPQAGNRFAQPPGAALPTASGEDAQAPSGRGAGLNSGAVLPGGIIPLRASQAEPMTVLQRTPLSLAAKAEALRVPLQNLAHLGAAVSDAGAERASRAGRQISEIVTDDGSSSAGLAGAILSGPEVGQAMGEAELASLRDAVAQPPIPSPAAGAVFPGAASGDRPSPAASPKALSAFGQAFDAASTYDGQSAADARAARLRGSFETPRPAAASRLDLSLLVLHVFDSALRFSRAEEETLARRMRALGRGLGAPPDSSSAGVLAAPPAPPPTYALGSRGPAAGPGSEALSARASAAASGAATAAQAGGAFDLPDSAGLPRTVPLPLAGSLLLTLIGVALFYLSEFRR